MSRRRSSRRDVGSVDRPLVGGAERVEEWPDGEWVVRSVSGSGSDKPYRCPGCSQLIPVATPHVVAWPAEGSTLSGGGIAERRHWHSGCWRSRDRRR